MTTTGAMAVTPSFDPKRALYCRDQRDIAGPRMPPSTSPWLRQDVMVAQDQFADRLQAATHEDDDEVIGLLESDPSEEDSLWISGDLFQRLTRVAAASELHALPMLGGSEPVRLNRAQCETLLDELPFVADRLNDPLATEAGAGNRGLCRGPRTAADVDRCTFEGD